MTERPLEPGFAALAAQDRHFSQLLADHGQPHVRSRPEGFESLLQIVVQQQLSLASAEAIWRRLSAGLGEVTPRRVLSHDEAALRGYGLSGAKVRYARSLAGAVDGGRLDLRGLAQLEDETAIEALIAIKGIGRWTAEIYLLTALQRPDVWPAADVALMIAAQDLKGLDCRPGARQMITLAESWRPWRAFAARLLWHFYRLRRKRDVPA